MSGIWEPSSHFQGRWVDLPKSWRPPPERKEPRLHPSGPPCRRELWEDPGCAGRLLRGQAIAALLLPLIPATLSQKHLNADIFRTLPNRTTCIGAYWGFLSSPLTDSRQKNMPAHAPPPHWTDDSHNEIFRGLDSQEGPTCAEREATV